MAETTSEIRVLKTTGALSSGATNGNREDIGSARGLILYADITASSGTSPTLTVKLQEWIPQANAGAGLWVDISGATTTAIDASSDSTTTLVVYPGCIASANAVVNRPVSEHFRYVATVGGSSTPTVTCSIHAALIP